jgi:hypothetical protein
MEPLLEWVANSQGRWSATASELKTAYERVRRITFALAILGALAASVATQVDAEPRRWLAVAGATLLAMGTLLSARFLGVDKAQHWVRARGASEALKRAAWLYAAQAVPYDDPARRDALLRAEVGKIEADVDDLLDQQAAGQRGSTPAAALAAQDYLNTRVGKAAAWYEKSADKHRADARLLRSVELFLAVATTVLTAVVGAVSKEWLQSTTGFDWAALIAVLTTLSGVVLAHIEASRFDYLVSSYRAAARRLRNELAAAPSRPAVPSPDWSDFVGRCEDIIANETGSWAARFSKPTAT